MQTNVPFGKRIDTGTSPGTNIFDGQWPCLMLARDVFMLIEGRTLLRLLYVLEVISVCCAFTPGRVITNEVLFLPRGDEPIT